MSHTNQRIKAAPGKLGPSAIYKLSSLISEQTPGFMGFCVPHGCRAIHTAGAHEWNPRPSGWKKLRSLSIEVRQLGKGGECERAIALPTLSKPGR